MPPRKPPQDQTITDQPQNRQPLQPLPDEAFVAARLRRIAADIILEAETLEAKAGRQPRRNPRLVVAECLEAIANHSSKGRKTR